MLKPVDAESVIREGGAVGRFPGDLHPGVAWWLGACFVVAGAAERLVVGSGEGPVAGEFFRRLCLGAINAHHHACRVTAVEDVPEEVFLRYVRGHGPLAAAYVSAAAEPDGDSHIVHVRLYDAAGVRLEEDTGLARIRRMIAEDRVPIPVNDSARGTIDPRPPSIAEAAT